MARMRMNQAISSAIADEMREDPTVVVFGEDVADAGGPFKTSDGLLEEFGPNRVRNTPISEMGFLGAAVGAAATGLRPVAEIMFVEFLGVALDQVVTEAALFHYLSAGRYRVPMTVRASTGAFGFGAQHSHTRESWLYGSPGLKLVSVSGPQSAYGLLRAAIRDDNPVVVLEPRFLYSKRSEVTTGEDSIIELGKAHTIQQGTDVTIIGFGSTVSTIKDAVALGSWSAEVIDLQTLIPWDREAILESVGRTKRLAIVEENPVSFGWGTDIASVVGAELFGTLEAPILRITCPDTPVPFPPDLEARYLPSSAYVASQVSELLETGRLPSHWWEELEVG
jgi:pyruvate/2-oxoglutarate/acetoin dehydrogenase E1 component